MPVGKVHKALRLVATRLFRIFSLDFVAMARIFERDDLELLGSEYGGWVVPASLLGRTSVVYCVGCGEDISFDLALIERFECEVWAFDPTPRSIRHVETAAAGVSRYHFKPLGIWRERTSLRFYAPKDSSHVSHSVKNLQGTSQYFEAQVDTLLNAMNEHGHTAVDLLKLDIEGAEYEVIESVLASGADIRVLCVEFDEYFHAADARYLARIRSTVRRLRSAGYRLVVAQGGANYTFVRE